MKKSNRITLINWNYESSLSQRKNQASTPQFAWVEIAIYMCTMYNILSHISNMWVIPIILHLVSSTSNISFYTFIFPLKPLNHYKENYISPGTIEPL